MRMGKGRIAIGALRELLRMSRSAMKDILVAQGGKENRRTDEAESSKARDRVIKGETGGSVLSVETRSSSARV